MGYREWRCCDPTTNRCYTSRDVVFNETSSWWSPEAAVLPGTRADLQQRPRRLEKKEDADRSVERSKARLVARVFSQQYGKDYDETFSPVAKIPTVRVLLALTASKSWRLWQMGVKDEAISDYSRSDTAFPLVHHPLRRL